MKDEIAELMKMKDEIAELRERVNDLTRKAESIDNQLPLLPPSPPNMPNNVPLPSNTNTRSLVNAAARSFVTGGTRRRRRIARK